jgi:hypothetical protein
MKSFFLASLSPITDYVLLAMRHFMFCYIATALLPWQGFRHTALPFVSMWHCVRQSLSVIAAFGKGYASFAID